MLLGTRMIQANYSPLAERNTIFVPSRPTRGSSLGDDNSDSSQPRDETPLIDINFNRSCFSLQVDNPLSVAMFVTFSAMLFIFVGSESRGDDIENTILVVLLGGMISGMVAGCICYFLPKDFRSDADLKTKVLSYLCVGIKVLAVILAGPIGNYCLSEMSLQTIASWIILKDELIGASVVFIGFFILIFVVALLYMIMCLTICRDCIRNSTFADQILDILRALNPAFSGSSSSVSNSDQPQPRPGPQQHHYDLYKPVHIPQTVDNNQQKPIVDGKLRVGYGSV